MRILNKALFRSLLQAADPQQTHSADQLRRRAGGAVPIRSLYTTCQRLVDHGYLIATGESQRRRYRRTQRGTDYLRVLNTDLPLRLCRALQGVSLDPTPLRAVADAVRQPHEVLNQTYAALHALAGLDLVTVKSQNNYRKTICLTPLGVVTLPEAEFVLEFHREAS